MSSETRSWFEGAVRSHGDKEVFTSAFASTARWVGKTPLNLTAAESDALTTVGIMWSLGEWCIDELGRVALIVGAIGDEGEEQCASLVEECFRRGETRERQAVVKALALLPHSERLTAVGVEACRTNARPLFEAIACDNPFPALRFTDLHFNQMVLKALFIGSPVDRIVWLDERLTPELIRMAADYASERRAAGRSVPNDIRRLTGPVSGG